MGNIGLTHFNWNIWVTQKLPIFCKKVNFEKPFSQSFLQISTSNLFLILFGSFKHIYYLKKKIAKGNSF